MESNMNEQLNLAKKIIEKQQELIILQVEERKNRIEKQKEIIENFNNLPSGGELYQTTLKEKVDIHKYRVKLYNQFIFKHGMEAFTNLLIKAHDKTDYLQNFYEFIDFCDEDVKTKIQIEFNKREFEMMKGVYMDFMPLLNPEKVVTHMVYLDEDFGSALDELDLLL